MAELEIRQEEIKDALGQRVGILAAVIALALAIVTISSHRAHTGAVLAKSEANDQWSFYQAKRLKLHNLELGRELASLMPAERNAAALIRQYRDEAQRYETESRNIQAKAEAGERRSSYEEMRALRFDIGEGLLELGLVLCSLYFIGRRGMFPALACIAGTAGICSAALALLVSGAG